MSSVNPQQRRPAAWVQNFGLDVRERPALKAIVLAGGKGGVTADGGSMLLQRLGERTVLDCVMENALAVVPAASIYVVVGYRQDEVRARLGQNYTYIPQEKPLGTGHAVLQGAAA